MQVHCMCRGLVVDFDSKRSGYL